MPDQRSFGTIAEVSDDLELRREQLRAHLHLVHQQEDGWAVDPEADPRTLDATLVASIRRKGTGEALYRLEDGVLYIDVRHGRIGAYAYSDDTDALPGMLDLVREHFPVYEIDDPDQISVTFWTSGANGPRSLLRLLDADAWDSIDSNYPTLTRPQIDLMMSDTFEPGVGGQLLLWHGDPGTGKTTALRCLAREWREWCDVHYIVDPEMFFGADAAYMMSVMLGGSQDLLDLDEAAAKPKWRLLVLEDCGEMLQPDARKEVGQALSRLLNACDGMIGRGLRVLVLVTTNEPVGKLHDAVARPGRCAMNVEFARFQPAEAAEWLAAHGAESRANQSRTLADLYGEIASFHTRETVKEVGFR